MKATFTYLHNGGTSEHAQQIANHESPRTTKLYDRTNDAISRDEIERLRIWSGGEIAMHGDLRQQIYLNFSQRNTEELVEIWRAHDCNEWSGMTFDVIQEILQERYVELPPHRESINEPDRLNENPARWLGERHDWVVIVGLCGSLLVFLGVATYRHEMMPWSSLLLVLLVGYWLAGIHYLITDTAALQADKLARWQKPAGWFVLAVSVILENC